MSSIPMVNEDYAPGTHAREILDLFTDGYPDEPWGVLTTAMIREQTGMSDGTIDSALNQLIGAGWVAKIHRGAYRLEYTQWATESEP